MILRLPRAVRFLVLCACGFASGGVRAAEPSHPPKILIFGDSITAGNALPAEERKDAWVSVLNREAGGKFLLINEGKGGRPTDSMKEFEQALARHPKFDALMIMLGTNDSRDVSGQCVPKAVANITAMIEHARRTRGAALPILLVGPPNLNKDALVATKPIAKEREANLRALDEAYLDLGGRLKVNRASVYGAVPETTLTRDGVHPDAKGNRALADALRPELESLVARLE